MTGQDYRRRSEQFKYQLDTLVKIGVSLSAENNLNRLLDMIVFHARQLTRADGGTLYLLADGRLRFTIIQNSTLGIHRGVRAAIASISNRSNSKRTMCAPMPPYSARPSR